MYIAPKYTLPKRHVQYILSVSTMSFFGNLRDVQFYNVNDVLFYSFSILFERVYYLIK